MNFEIRTSYDRTEGIEEKLAKLQKKFSSFSFDVSTREETYTKGFYNGHELSVTDIIHTIDISNEVLLHGDYTYLCTLKATETDENLVHAFNNETDMSRFYTIDFRCDHCNTERLRKTVHVFTKDNKEYMIASTCVKEYFGIDVERELNKLFAAVKGLQEVAEEEESYGKGERPPLDINFFCKAICGQIYKSGKYVSQKNSDFDIPSTNTIVSTVISSAITKKDMAEYLQECMNTAKDKNYDFEAIRKYWANKEDSTFTHNVNINLKLRQPSTGILAYAVWEYIKEVLDFFGTKNSGQNHVGSIKDKLSFEGLVIQLRNFENMYTNGTYVTIKDDNGNIFVWKSSKLIEIETNKKYQIKGTIKYHSEYNGTKQTNLTRCKII